MDWYERTRMLIGNEAVEKLAQANVIIFGVGGVGSYISEAVARAGVGNITLVDNDTVAETNLNRQIVALKSTIGSMKTQVMADRIKEINPSCNVKTINEFVLYDNIDDILTDEYSYVADAVDTVTAKLAIIMKAKELNIPVTQVEHWFRNDKSFAIPDKDIWKNLKECLNINSDEWDKSILSFEEKESNFDKNNRIYDSEGIAPTLTSTNIDEKIIEPKCLNSKGGRNGVAGLQPSVQDRAYDPDGIATAVTTSFMPNILEKNKPAKVLGSIYCENSEQFGTKIMPLAHTLKASKCDVAIVEKLNDEPKINVVGNYSKSNHDATRIVETNGLAPTVRECHGSVTAIVEDEAQINMLGLLDINGNDQVRRVYGVDGLSPTLNTMQGGNTQPKIIEGKEVSVAAIRGRYNEEGNVEQHLEKGTNEYSNTITTVTKDNVLIEKDKSTMKKVGQISTEGSQCGSVYSDNGLFPTLSAGCHGYANPHIYTRYRIRKLTPVECGRLMDVDMDDIIRMIVSDYEEANKILEYMRKNNITYKGKEEMDELIKHQKMSNSRLYKQYGNSIVVGVMCAMFRNLNIKGVERWSD